MKKRVLVSVEGHLEAGMIRGRNTCVKEVILEEEGLYRQERSCLRDRYDQQSYLASINLTKIDVT